MHKKGEVYSDSDTLTCISENISKLDINIWTFLCFSRKSCKTCTGPCSWRHQWSSRGVCYWPRRTGIGLLTSHTNNCGHLSALLDMEEEMIIRRRPQHLKVWSLFSYIHYRPNFALTSSENKRSVLNRNIHLYCAAQSGKTEIFLKQCFDKKHAYIAHVFKYMLLKNKILWIAFSKTNKTKVKRKKQISLIAPFFMLSVAYRTYLWQTVRTLDVRTWLREWRIKFTF